jgi:hypothetical protein
MLSYCHNEIFTIRCLIRAKSSLCQYKRASCDNFPMSSVTYHAGPLALAQMRAHGLRARDIAVVPAAAGGPKELIFRSLDQWVFGKWSPRASGTHPDRLLDRRLAVKRSVNWLPLSVSSLVILTGQPSRSLARKSILLLSV